MFDTAAMPPWFRELMEGIQNKDPRFIMFHTDTDVPSAIFPFPLDVPLNEVKALSFRYVEVTDITPQIGEMSEIFYIEMDSLPIAKIPKKLGLLRQLKCLSINNTAHPFVYTYQEDKKPTKPYGLKDLPAELAQLTELTSLKLEGNLLEYIPECIFEMTQLTSLDLYGNKIRHVSERLGNLTALTYLKLSSNSFHQLPESIGQLQQLVRLRLDNLHLYGLPESIGQLQRLECLEICNGQLDSIPASIQQLNNLKALYLINTQIDEITLNALNVFLPNTKIITDMSWGEEE